MQENAYHDHNHCIQEAISEAHNICQRRGVKLTPLREKILKLVWQNHQPTGAYHILAELTKYESRPTQPPTVYRALEFLQKQKLVHRLSSINAYIGCSNPKYHSNSRHSGNFFICYNCRATIEVQSIKVNRALHCCAKDYGFSITGEFIELSGLCCNCSNGK